MSAGIDDIVRAHTAFGPPTEVIERRRAVYHATIEMAGGPVVADAVVDNPAVRAHLGEVLGGVASFDPGQLRPVGTLSASEDVIPIDGQVLRLASADSAQLALSGALDRVVSEMDHRAGGQQVAPTVLTGRSDRFPRSRAFVVDGVQLAVDAVPEVASDLISHVALLAVLDAGTTGGLGSASVREYPGLLMMPEPESVIEAAEAFVHEAAHQLFFDFAMDHTVLAPDDHRGERYSPGWASASAPPWPFEQVVAAFHTYSCLAAFASRALPTLSSELHEFSLLPVAAERAVQLADWLEGHGDRLGPDGQRFVRLLGGRGIDDISSAGETTDAIIDDIWSTGGPLVVRNCGRWTLIIAGARERPALYWMTSTAAGRIDASNGSAHPD